MIYAVWIICLLMKTSYRKHLMVLPWEKMFRCHWQKFPLDIKSIFGSKNNLFYLIQYCTKVMQTFTFFHSRRYVKRLNNLLNSQQPLINLTLEMESVGGNSFMADLAVIRGLWFQARNRIIAVLNLQSYLTLVRLLVHNPVKKIFVVQCE